MILRIFWKPIVWLAFICYGLFIPASNIPSAPFLSIPHFDKFVHFTLFFILCLLLFRPFDKLRFKSLFTAPAVSLALGIALEVAQQQVTNSRSSDFYDFLANLTGIIVALLFYILFVQGRRWQILF